MNNPDLYRPCVGITLFKPGHGVWSGKRIGHFDYAWQMPQGGIDAGENAEAAAYRELKEETSVTSVKLIDQSNDWLFYDIPKETVSKFWGGKYLGQRQKWFLFEFTGKDSEINIETEDPEFSQWSWEHPDFLLENGVNFKRDVYLQVFQYWNKHLKLSL